MSQPEILFVLTSHNKLGDTGKPTGWYLPEFAHPYEVLAPHAHITIASPAGGDAPLDPSSVEAFKDDKICSEYLNSKQDLWKHTEKLESFTGKAKDFDAIFYVGGHGPMWDLATSQTSIDLIREFHSASRIISAVCHGPAAFVNATLTDGSYLIKDTPVTGFSNAEEDAVGTSPHMPFMLEDELKKRGGKFEKASEPWAEKVVVAHNGKFITGQNPASATGVGKALLEALGKK